MAYQQPYGASSPYGAPSPYGASPYGARYSSPYYQTPQPPPQPPSAPAAASELSTSEVESSQLNFDDVPQHIQVNPRYIATGQGVFTLIETIIATLSMLFYLLMASRITYQWYAHMTFMLAFTYTLNNMLIVIAGMSSPSTQLYLPQTTFSLPYSLQYVLYHLMAGLIYVICGALFHNWDYDDDLPYRFLAGLIATSMGVLHLFHTLFNIIG